MSYVKDGPLRVVFVGRVSLKPLAECFQFERVLLDVKWSFPLGSEIVAGLVRRGHEVHVVTEHTVEKVETFQVSGFKFQVSGDKFQGLGCGKLVVHLVPSWKRSRWSFLTLFAKEVRGMRRVIREIKPDVVFAQWTYHNAYAGLTSGYPTLVVAHDSPWRVLKTYRNAFALIRAVYAQLFVFPRMEHLTTVSPHMVEDLQRLNRYKRDIKVIPNGIEVSGSKFQVSSFRFQVSGEEAGGMVVRKEAKTIVCVSQAGRLKNTQVLVEAFEILRAKHPEWHLLMLGLGLKDGVVTREERDRILREEADVFCSPSLEESFGMVFVEAMLQGVPCVGGEKSGAVPWVLGNGEAGVLTDVTKPDVLARTLERVMLDCELRKRLSAAGIKRVREKFDIERVIDMYEEELKRVAKVG